MGSVLTEKANDMVCDILGRRTRCHRAWFEMHRTWNGRRYHLPDTSRFLLIRFIVVTVQATRQAQKELQTYKVKTRHFDVAV